jgi:Holliday junction resolvasome RuvABC endonuclease subunit
MLMMRLGLAEEPQEDAGDALALAVCHLQRIQGHAALAPEPI